MTYGWATNSSEPQKSATLLSQIGKLANTVGKFKNWAFYDWEQDLFNCLNTVSPVLCAYSFEAGETKKYFAIIANPSSENILKLVEAYCGFEDRITEKNNSFYCDFLVFGQGEEEYLGIPDTARKITLSSEEDYARTRRTLSTVQA